jgi:hypothetical protein
MSPNVMFIALRSLSVPKRSSPLAVDDASGDVSTDPTAAGVDPVSPCGTDVWVFVSVLFLSTQPRTEAAITSTIKMYIHFIFYTPAVSVVSGVAVALAVAVVSGVAVALAVAVVSGVAVALAVAVGSGVAV